MTSLLHIPLLLLNIIIGSLAQQDDQEVIKQMLYDFLENVDQKIAHDRFWSETLVYTSSSGARFGKAEIMSGFESEEEPKESEPKTSYSAEEVNIQLIENTAILTFKLIAKTNGAEPSRDEYYNSGTLTKESAEWKIVCWQATKIPTE